MAAATAVDRLGTKAKVRYVRMSASKARVVLKLIRGKGVAEAAEILEFTERLAADPIGKCLASAVANAQHNEELLADELFISACYADEGPTLKRFRPRARGRAGRINKQTCHITIEVARYTDDELDEARKRNELKDEGRQKRSSSRSSGGGDRARRVARSRAAEASDTDEDQTEDDQVAEDQVAEDQVADDQVDATEAEDATTDEAAVETTDASDDATEADAADEADADATATDDADETDSDADTTTEDATDEVATDDDPEDDAGVKN
ncbi:MAG: 50S ribosomal protein L22 [Actinomycetota bacterium]